MKIFFAFLGLALVVFLPALSAEFLAYDDRIHIVANPFLNDHNFLHFWVNSYFGLFIPVIYNVWTFFHVLFGTNSFVFHAANVVVHALNGWLVYRLCRHFKFSAGAALVAGLVFLLHPLQVESVAWASALKDVLSLFLGLLALDLYFRNKNIFLVTGLLILAVFTKPSMGVLPVILLFFCHKNNSARQNWLLFSAALAGLGNLLLAKYLQSRSDVAVLPEIGVFERVAVVFDSLGFYITRFFVPLELYPDYGRTPQFVLNGNFWQNCIAAVVFLALLFFVLRRNRNFFLLFALAFSFLIFLPTSGIISFEYQAISTVADRYFYGMCVGFAVLAALAYEKASGKRLTNFVAFSLLGLLAVCSFVQTLSWRNNQVFFEYMLEGNSQSFNATNNLGVLAQMAGSDDKAIEYFLKAKELRPLELTPVAGLISVYSKRHDHAALDVIAAEYLTEERFKKMVLPGHSTSVALKLYGDSLLERNRLSEAQDFFCRAAVLSQPMMNSLVPVIDKIAKETGKNCPGRN